MLDGDVTDAVEARALRFDLMCCVNYHYVFFIETQLPNLETVYYCVSLCLTYSL